MIGLVQLVKWHGIRGQWAFFVRSLALFLHGGACIVHPYVVGYCKAV